MTLKHLRGVLITVLATYTLAILVAILLRGPFDLESSGIYQTYKDLMPLIVAIPAAYLAFAFQRRNSYLQALRVLWSHLVEGISTALVYTERHAPTEEQYLATLEKLSTAIEEVRGVFKNIPARGAPSGWYPFEPVKQIYQEVKDLGFGEKATARRREESRERIYLMWKQSREQLLAEFDRDKPTHHHAHYAPEGPVHGAAAPLKPK